MNMKNRTIIYAVLAALAFSFACSSEDDNDESKEKTGTLKFQTLNPLTSATKSMLATNPALTGDTTETINTSMQVCIGDVWVSQEEVVAGGTDDLEWVRLTSETNRELKLIEDYTFDPIELPVGTYKSIKMTLKNIFYRHVELASDPSVKYELLETMGSTFDPCDPNDTSWTKTNYFSAAGNHKINDGGVFEVVAPGETIAGFTIEEAKTVIVAWRFGAGATEPCINYLIDLNDNLIWDCGIDDMIIECPPDMENMADFVISYE
ncbi:MAG: hypothetical protein JXB49_37385 [Bacteroidales bacterium]|nr:hypothetical protein [Bacteroidales bacterium]